MQSAKITIAVILVIGVFSISVLTVPAFAEWDKLSYPQIQGTVPVSSMFDTMSIQSFVDQTQKRHGDPVTTKKFFEQRGFDLNAPMVSVSLSEFDLEAATDETGIINPMGADYVKQGDVQIGVEDDTITIERNKYRQLSDCFCTFKDTGVSKYTIEEGKPIYMTGAELYESTGADYTEQKNGIALSVAMAVGENSVSDGKAMYAKLADVNGFLVHKVVLITEDHGYYKVLVDAGNGEALYVSDMIKKDYSHKKHSGEKHNDKMKNYFKGMSDEQIAEKKLQFKEMGEAYKSLSIQDRASMIIHFMQMKLQWDTMSDDEKMQKKADMKQMFKEYLPLTLEEKKQKLHEYIQSLN